MIIRYLSKYWREISVDEMTKEELIGLLPKKISYCKPKKSGESRQCKQCGKEYTFLYGNGLGAFCSIECKKKNINDTRNEKFGQEIRAKKSKAKLLSCSYCGNEFFGVAKYCSKECKNMDSHYKLISYRKCITCGKEFYGTEKNKNCSSLCAGINHISKSSKLAIEELMLKYKTRSDLPKGITKVIANDKYDDTIQRYKDIYKGKCNNEEV